MHIREWSPPLFLIAGILAGGITACGDSSPTGPRNGSIRVETTSAGEDLDPNGYNVSLDQAQATAIGLFDHLVFTGLGLGTHQVVLGGIAENCSTASANPQPTDVVAGDTVVVSFEITCETIGPPGDGGGPNVISTSDPRSTS